jgi:hypothetical protein
LKTKKLSSFLIAHLTKFDIPSCSWQQFGVGFSIAYMDSQRSREAGGHGGAVSGDGNSEDPICVPYQPNKDFVPRPKLLDRLNHLLMDENHHERAALCGPGGSG